MLSRIARSSLLLTVCATAFCAPVSIEWSFNGTLDGKAGGKQVSPDTSASAKDVEWVQGVAGKTLRVSPGKPVAYAVPSAFAQAGALSFYYRLPQNPPDKLEILRLGEHSLIWHGARLLWHRRTGPESESKGWVIGTAVSVQRSALVEIGWSAEQGAVIFTNGVYCTVMNSFTAGKPAEETIPLLLLAGTFEDMILCADSESSGARFRGIIYQERFDGKDVPLTWAAAAKSGDARLIPGFDGSAGALATPVKDGRYISLHFPFGFYRVTPDTYICGAFYSSNGKTQSVVVRAWPKMENPHPNSWLRRQVPSAQWIVEKLPVLRFSVKPGWVVQDLSFGSEGPGERYLAVDNICLFRGEDTEPPTKVPDLKAEEKDGAVRIVWGRATDNICVAAYNVYWSNVPQFRFSDAEIITSTLEHSFSHELITHPGDWYVTVAAVDVSGNAGPAADPVKVTVTR